MSSADEVFARFVEANPVPDESAATLAPPPVAELRGGERIDGRGPQRSLPRPWIGGPLVAAAAFIGVLVLGGAWLAWQAISANVEPVDPAEARAQAAIAAVEELVAARNRGDIDAAMELSAPAARDTATRRVYEWLAGFAANGMPLTVGDCDVSEAGPEETTVGCRVTLGDAVAVELRLADQQGRFRYAAGLVTELEFRGDSISVVNSVYSEYMRSFYPDEYADLCDEFGNKSPYGR